MTVKIIKDPMIDKVIWFSVTQNQDCTTCTDRKTRLGRTPLPGTGSGLKPCRKWFFAPRNLQLKLEAIDVTGLDATGD